MGFAVPNVPGVPALFGGFSPVAAIGSLVDVTASLPTSMAPKWGIFLSGSPVVTADSVISMDARQEAVIADYPLEGGSFESYDKVDRPFDVRFRFSAGGDDANRSALFSSVKKLFADKSKFYMFVSPEDVFESVTISHYDYHRTATNGVGLPVVDVWGWQLLVGNSGVTGSTTDTQSPGATPPANDGTVQPQPVLNQLGQPTGTFQGGAVNQLGQPIGNSVTNQVSSSPLLTGGSTDLIFPSFPSTSSLSLK